MKNGLGAGFEVPKFTFVYITPKLKRARSKSMAESLVEKTQLLTIGEREARIGISGRLFKI